MEGGGLRMEGGRHGEDGDEVHSPAAEEMQEVCGKHWEWARVWE
jgi:hypothetical protein